MSPPRPAVLTLVLSLAGCGTLANDELDFTAALPELASLTTTLPRGVSSSSAYLAVKAAADGHDAILFTSLASLGLGQVLPPSSRQGAVRRWGPVADSRTPSLSIGLEVRRHEPTRFAYHLEVRPAAQEPLHFVEGSTTLAQRPGYGQGEIFIYPALVAPHTTLPEVLAPLREVAVRYDTSARPDEVEVLATPTTATASPQATRWQRSGEVAGTFRFSRAGAEAVASWGEDGAGRLSLDGRLEGCWGPAGQTTFERLTDGGVLGQEASCAQIEGL